MVTLSYTLFRNSFSLVHCQAKCHIYLTIGQGSSRALGENSVIACHLTRVGRVRASITIFTTADVNNVVY